MGTRDPIQCPRCHDGSSLTSRGKRYPLYPAGLVVLLGLPLAILHQSSSATICRCGKCGKDFGLRSTLARICLVILIVVLIPTLLMVMGLVAVLLR
ncbi:hypothetical protein [Luteolibacter sp. Populi]|uniref:hypothetical protein n=1 Tax=Luteolibacter sp. Populi TaxID=3230487 RepID=UPI00346678A2